MRLTVWSDYLCPWCFNASVRMDRLAEEYARDLEIEWRSFFLRPEAKKIDPEAFRAYTKSWLRPAQDEPAGSFRVWSTDAAPPSHSIPPHRAAKAAATLGPDAFRRMHRRLLEAYFAENRDVTDPATLRALWEEAGLPAAEVHRIDDPEHERRAWDEHREALAFGVNGVPAFRMEGTDVPVTGALPLDAYRKWIEKFLARERKQET